MNDTTLCLSPPSDSATSPLNNRARRRPLGALTLLVNSLENTRSKLNFKLARSVSLMARMGDFSAAHKDEDTSDEDDDNETTLNDDDILSLPTQKKAAISLVQLLEVLEEHFRSNEFLPSTSINTFRVSQDVLPRIDEHEMQRIILGAHADQFDEYVVIDCRFPYEYDGGHIVNAINIPLHVDLEKFVERHSESASRRLLIFHCEYSIFRGPTMASHLRKVDRVCNADRYPHLYYPDIVVLEGGYKRFFDKYKLLCQPQAYVEMKDIKHKRTCEVEMNKMIQASKLTRAKSFNQFQPRMPAAHTRSSSFTGLNSSSENNLATPGVRRSRSKIYKKERARPMLFSQSLISLLMSSPKPDSPVLTTFDHDDFAPPPVPTLFRTHSSSLSSLLVSVHSSQLLVCSESFSAFSSTDSLLLDSYSHFVDSSDYFDATPSNSGNLLASSASFSFPKAATPGFSASNKARLTLARPSARPAISMALSSPTVSSPLSTTPASAFESSASNNTLLMMDDINDAPVDFSFGLRHSHGRLFSYLNGPSSLALDINEADEESD